MKRFPLAFLSAVLLPASLHAQVLGAGRDTAIVIDGNHYHGYSDFARRSSGSIGFTQTRPLGALANNIGFGYGGSGNYVYRLDKAGILGLRLGGAVSRDGAGGDPVPFCYTHRGGHLGGRAPPHKDWNPPPRARALVPQ